MSTRPPVPPWPSFYLIGAPRTGTRWLRYNLDQHPDICAPPLDLHYFAHPEVMVSTSTRWYREQFGSWQGQALVGEASPRYTAHLSEPDRVAERMHRQVPEARLIAIARQPMDRMLSAAEHGILTGEVPPQDQWGELTPEQVVGLLTRLSRDGVYNVNLSRFRELFGDQLKIMLYDDLQADPAAFYADALAHIGADPSFVPEDVARVRYASPDVGVRPFPPGERPTIYEWFRLGVDELSGWLGRDLSSWDPARAA